MLKSNKGYSLIEIGVGILILTVFLLISIGLFNGCYNNYRRIKQRNIATDRAIYYMENMLQTDKDVLTGFMVQTLDPTTNAYTLQPNETFKLFVKNNFSSFKSRYAQIKGIDSSSVSTLSDDELVEYINADKEYLINQYIRNDAINNASVAQLQNGSYGFLKEDGRFTDDNYEIVIENDMLLDDTITFPEGSTFINANGGAFRIKKTISRIPSTNGTAFGNNLLRLRVDVYFSYDFAKVLTEQNTQVITLDTIKI